MWAYSITVILMAIWVLSIGALSTASTQRKKKYCHSVRIQPTGVTPFETDHLITLLTQTYPPGDIE
jgi:hypothetical protein